MKHRMAPSIQVFFLPAGQYIEGYEFENKKTLISSYFQIIEIHRGLYVQRFSSSEFTAGNCASNQCFPLLVFQRNQTSRRQNGLGHARCLQGVRRRALEMMVFLALFCLVTSTVHNKVQKKYFDM